MGENRYSISIFAPMTGKVVDLSEVPDPLYAGRMMGDGVAIMPEDGAVFSPVTGVLNVIAEDKHAFGFTSDDGLELMVHVGIKSKIPPECIGVEQKINTRVQAGDMVAQFDLEKMKQQGINILTPVLICGGLNGKTVHPAVGHVQAGAGEIMKIVDEEAKARYEAEKQRQQEAAPQPKAVTKASQKMAAESEAIEFLRDKANWPKLLGGFAVLTLLLVVVFVSIAMLIGR